MKKMMLAALAAAAFATPAFSAPATVQLFGTNPVSCDVINNAPESALSLASTAAQSTGSLTYRCNIPGGLQRSIASANNGKLTRGTNTGEGNEIPYLVSHTGGSGVTIAAPGVAPTTPILTSLTGSTAFINGQTGSLSVTLQPPSALFAGEFTDTLTVTLGAL